MGSKTVFYAIETDRSLAEVREATKRSLMALGGMVVESGDSFQVKQGSQGVDFAFSAQFDAMVTVRQLAPSKYEFLAMINWSPNGLFWACLIIGLFVFGILWVVPLLYLFINPSNAYQQALMRIPSMLT